MLIESRMRSTAGPPISTAVYLYGTMYTTGANQQRPTPLDDWIRVRCSTLSVECYLKTHQLVTCTPSLGRPTRALGDACSMGFTSGVGRRHYAADWDSPDVPHAMAQAHISTATNAMPASLNCSSGRTAFWQVRLQPNAQHLSSSAHSPSTSQVCAHLSEPGRLAPAGSGLGNQKSECSRTRAAAHTMLFFGGARAQVLASDIGYCLLPLTLGLTTAVLTVRAPPRRTLADEQQRIQQKRWVAHRKVRPLLNRGSPAKLVRSFPNRCGSFCNSQTKRL